MMAQQLEQLQNTAVQKFSKAVENNKPSFLPNLTSDYFSYLITSWGLEKEERRLLSSIFLSKINTDIKKFCENHRINYIYIRNFSLSDTITSTLLEEEYCLDADIFMRRLLLDCLNIRKKNITAYKLPHEEHHEILSNYLTEGISQNNITQKQKEAIFSASQEYKDKFINDTLSYQTSPDDDSVTLRNLIYLTIPLLPLLYLINYFFAERIQRFIYDEKHKNDIGAYFLHFFFFAVPAAITFIALRKVSPKKQNFDDMSKLPDESKNFLLEKSNALKEKLLSVFEEKPLQKKTSQTSKPYPINRDDTDDTYNYSSNSSSHTPKPEIPSEAKQPEQKIPLPATLKESPKQELQIKTMIIQWQYTTHRTMETVIYNPTFRHEVIKLWNYTMPYLKDYIYWNTKEIEGIINNPVLYSKIAIKAWDGHRIKRTTDTQGFLMEGSSYIVKILGLMADPRLKFNKVATSKIPDSNEKAHLYAVQKLKPKHTKRN